MKSVVIATLCILLATVGLARAELEVDSWAPDVEADTWVNTDGDDLSLTECRGMTVVLFFWVTWHSGGEQIMPLMNQVDSSPYGRQGGVFLLGITDASESRVEELLDKEKVRFPVGTGAKQTFEDYEIEQFPRVVIIDPKGRVQWTGWPAEGGGSKLVDEIRRIADETPPTKTHPEEATKVHAYRKESLRALKRDNFRSAFTAARGALLHALRGDSLRTDCQDVIDLIEALGRDKLARAEQAADEKRYEDAVMILMETKHEFRGLGISSTARSRLDALAKAKKEVAKLIQAYEDSAVAENVLAQALNLIRERDFGAAFDNLERIVNEFPSTETVTKAKVVIQRMRANEGIMGYVLDHQAARTCRSLLSQADAYQRAGQVSKARQLYREVIDKHPGTIYEHEAIERLKKLP